MPDKRYKVSMSKMGKIAAENTGRFARRIPPAMARTKSNINRRLSRVS